MDDLSLYLEYESKKRTPNLWVAQVAQGRSEYIVLLRLWCILAAYATGTLELTSDVEYFRCRRQRRTHLENTDSAAYSIA